MDTDLDSRVERWIDTLLKLISQERDAEVLEVAQLFQNASQQDLQKRGVVLNNVRISGKTLKTTRLSAAQLCNRNLHILN